MSFDPVTYSAVRSLETKLSTDVPVGGVALFPYTVGDNPTIAGKTYLKLGVTTYQSNFPTIPTPPIRTFGVGYPVYTSVPFIPMEYAYNRWYGIQGNNFKSTTDFVNFTDHGDSTNSGTWNSPNLMIKCGGSLIASCYHGVWATTNGTSWSARGSAGVNLAGSYHFAATSGVMTLIANFDAGIGRLSTTADSFGWGYVNLPSTAITALGYSPVSGLFLLGCNEGLYTSPDCITWTLRRSGTVMYGIASGNGACVTFQQGTFIRSMDGGLTWSNITKLQPNIVINASYNIAELTFVNDVFVFVVNTSKTILTSTDGNIWRSPSNLPEAAVSTSKGRPYVGYGMVNGIPKYLVSGGYNAISGYPQSLLDPTQEYIDNFAAASPAQLQNVTSTYANSSVHYYLRVL